MKSSRIEAFSDGVLAIIITIMVLELKLPEQHTLHAFVHTTGLSLLTYLLTFVYVGIYWNNHHHLFLVASNVDGLVMWANLHLLFWLSLFPLTNNWMDESHLALWPTAVYGFNLVGASASYFLLEMALRRLPGHQHLDEVYGVDIKAQLSVVLYLVGVGLCFVKPWIGVLPYVFVATMWLVPDRRVERWIQAQGTADEDADE